MIYIVNQIKKHPLKKELEIIPLLSNIEGCKIGQRYKDTDLNRSFSSNNINSLNTTPNNYENKRAQEINKMYGQDSEFPVDFLIDLHTTTANMGRTIIIDGKNKIVNKLCRYLVGQIDDLKIIINEDITKLAINNITQMALTIEIGCVPTNIYDPNAIAITTEILKKTIEYLEKLNSGDLIDASPCEAYKVIKPVAFPKNDSRDIDVIIHENIHGKDFQKIKLNDPIFRLSDGKSLLLEESGEWYPIFINEAAYYEKNIAFYLTNKIKFDN